MKQIHFIAIGGAIMHQLALTLHKKGYIITGSDDDITDPAKSNLANEGLLPPHTGWFPEKLTKRIDAVILGMHAKIDNPELLQAQKLNIPIFSFPEYIYEISKNKKRVVVAGSHGKTTITAMIMHILKSKNIDFDYLVGAKIAGFNQSVKLSDAQIIILEGDEYPASVIEKKPKILFYHPHISVLSGIAWDHINVFPTYEIYFNQFEQYLSGLEQGTKIFYNSEDDEVKRAINTSASHLSNVPYSTSTYRYIDGMPVISFKNIDVPVSVFGKHNFLNMQAAIQICMELGLTEEECYKGISTFTGAALRLEKLKEEKNLIVFRDFAHAPSKLKATLNAVREAYSSHQLIACFELHTFSSLNAQFLSEYAHSMDAADKSFVFYSEHALKLKGLPSIDKNEIIKYFKKTDLIVTNKKEQLIIEVDKFIRKQTKPIILLLMSSGTFDGIDWNCVSSHK